MGRDVVQKGVQVLPTPRSVEPDPPAPPCCMCAEATSRSAHYSPNGTETSASSLLPLLFSLWVSHSISLSFTSSSSSFSIPPWKLCNERMDGKREDCVLPECTLWRGGRRIMVPGVEEGLW